MEFKRVLFLKKEMIKKLNRENMPLTEQEVYSMDALTLAYIGDASWSLFVRKKLIDTGIHHVQILNSLASEMVSAKWQCQILYTLRDQLTERELKVSKRARNAHVHVPKSATVEEYREATAFEGLLGYLRLSGQEERLHTIMLKSLKFLAEEFNSESK